MKNITKYKGKGFIQIQNKVKLNGNKNKCFQFPTPLERSFRDLLKQDFLKNLFDEEGEARAYLIHEVKNLAFHSNYYNLFNYGHMKSDGKVTIVSNAMPNYRDWWCPGEIGWNEDFPTPYMLDALVIPLDVGHGSLEHIKVCISVDQYFRRQLAISFQVKGSNHTSYVRVTPKNCFEIAAKLIFPYEEE